jgi:adenylate cyclase
MEFPKELEPVVEGLFGPPEMTSAEVARASGVDLDLAGRLWQALGFPPVHGDVRFFTRADVTVLRVVSQLLERDGIEPAVVLQLTRVMGRSLALIADAQVSATGALWERRVAEASAVVPEAIADLESVIGYVWRRHLLAALLRRSASPAAADREVAVGFADLVGFTALSQAMDARDLAAIVDRFEAIAYEQVPARGGRVVKMIGDEVMFAVDDRVAAADIGLGLVEAHARDEQLPDVRVGLAHGPTVAWEGDLYGPTVNLASRLVNVARPASVLVSDALGQALEPTGFFVLRHLRPVPLQGIGRVRSWVLRRPGPGR